MRPAILMIAGFGDDASMFAGLSETALAQYYRLIPLDLPGFGAPSQAPEQTSLSSLGSFVAGVAKTSGANVLLAHSVASIIASLAAREADGEITTILSLEGNLTAEDAYFSGSASGYGDPLSFRSAFLARLDSIAEQSKGEAGAVMRRYRQVVARADAVALWRLGQDAYRFSQGGSSRASSSEVGSSSGGGSALGGSPGEVLAAAARAVYFYNPQNCPEASLRWLESHPMEAYILDGASHWPSVDQPHLLAEKVLMALG